MFSAQTGAELLKAILKSTLVGCVTGFYLWHHWPQMMRLMAQSPITAMANAMDVVGLCALLVVLGVIPMVGFDVFFQIFSHLKKLRMSRQDIRDEFKQSEGDPHVKGRIRQMQRAAARRRMMADVPKADVIVNNPTHYSVALQYDENKMSAPKVVAKGAGLVALRIREIAAENNVPTLEAPPLARAVSTRRNRPANSRSTVCRRGGSAGLGLATETLASGRWTTPCTTDSSSGAGSPGFYQRETVP